MPINAGRPGRSSQVLASRCQRSAADIAENRSVATVGAQYGPSPLAGSGSGMPLAIRPAAAATSRIRPSRTSPMPVVLASRLRSRIPSPPLRSSETGAAPRICSSTSSSRSRSMTAPAATASTSSGGGGRHHRVGCRQLHRTGVLAPQHLRDVPGQDHGLGIDAPQQAHRQ